MSKNFKEVHNSRIRTIISAVCFLTLGEACHLQHGLHWYHPPAVTQSGLDDTNCQVYEIVAWSLSHILYPGEDILETGLFFYCSESGHDFYKGFLT